MGWRSTRPSPISLTSPFIYRHANNSKEVGVGWRSTRPSPISLPFAMSSTLTSLLCNAPALTIISEPPSRGESPT